MFRGKTSGRLRFIALFAVLCLGRAADLKLSIAGIDADRRPTLVVTGLSTGDYGLQASTNLIRWVDLMTNLVSFPYENEMRTALVFQPDEFQFSPDGADYLLGG